MWPTAYAALSVILQSFIHGVSLEAGLLLPMRAYY